MSILPITPRLPTPLFDGLGTRVRRTGAGYSVDILPAAFPGASYTSAPDANYQALVTDVQIGFAVLTAARTVTLPDVDLYPIAQVLFIADESGQCSADRPITITVGAGTSDTIGGQVAIQITDAYQGIGFRRGAANLWIIAR